ARRSFRAAAPPARPGWARTGSPTWSRRRIRRPRCRRPPPCAARRARTPRRRWLARPCRRRRRACGAGCGRGCRRPHRRLRRRPWRRPRPRRWSAPCCPLSLSPDVDVLHPLLPSVVRLPVLQALDHLPDRRHQLAAHRQQLTGDIAAVLMLTLRRDGSADGAGAANVLLIGVLGHRLAPDVVGTAVAAGAEGGTEPAQTAFHQTLAE